MGASMGADRIGEWNPQPGAVTVPLSNGLTGPTTTGTATARTVSSGGLGLQEAVRRIGAVSAAAINSVGGFHSAQFPTVTAIATPGTGRFPGGGFKALFEVGISDAAINAEAKMFFGMASAVGAPTAVDPKTLSRIVGFGMTSGQTTLRAMCTDNVGGVQEVDLGANFPVNALASEGFWRAVIVCPVGQLIANNMVFNWTIERLKTGHVASGTFTGPVAPIGGTQMAPRLWRSTGPAVATAVGIDLCLVRVETQL